MLAKCKGGPYDGTELDHNDINLYAKIMPVGVRNFVALPAFQNWDAVRRSEIDADKAFDKSSPFYELIRTPDGMDAVYDHGCERFGAANRDEREGRGPKPVEQPFTGSYYQCIRGEWAVGTDGRFAVTDEKGRTWACKPITRDEGERSDIFADLPELSRAHDQSGISDRLIVNTVHCESPGELSATLADHVD